MFPRLGAFGALRRVRVSPWVILFAVFCLLETLIHLHSLRVSVPPEEMDEIFHRGCTNPANYREREKAVLVMLARNGEVKGALSTLRMVEQRFNRFFHYPIMFVNDEQWEPDVMAALNSSVSGEAIFEQIPTGKWGYPKGMDVEAAEKAMEGQGRNGVKYGSTVSYHHMCRFFSG